MLAPSRTIILRPQAPQARPLPESVPLATAAGATLQPTDRFQRRLTDLRISVTDRCNFRCTYCMPRETYGPGHVFLPPDALLSFEDIVRVSRLMVPLGVRKLRLTGGEPLMRKQLDRLVAALSSLQTPEGQPLDMAMTTNGSLLSRHARAIRLAGLQRLTVSLDALDNHVFQRMNGAGGHVRDVLQGIDSAQAAGFENIKVNMVVQRGVNEHQVLPMAQYFRHRGIELRFIEYMDVGATNRWQAQDVVTAHDIRQQIEQQYALTALPASQDSETAQRFAYADGAGTLGLIASVTQPFCRHCTRLRLSTDGKLYTCLFATQGTDLRAALRQGKSDGEIQAGLHALWMQRHDQYSQLRSAPQQHSAATSPAAGSALDHASRIEMSYIGG